MDSGFQNIKNEAIRQLEAIDSASSRNDRKLEVLFGIALTIFGYIFSQQSFLKIFASQNYPLIILFCFGLAFVIRAVFIGYVSYKSKWHAVGPSTQEIYQQAQSGDKRVEETLLHNINRAIEHNHPLQDKKWKSFNRALESVGIGVVILLIVRLLYFFSTN